MTAGDSQQPFKPVSRERPCPICRKDGWCGLTPDGQAVRCMRVADPPTGWTIVKPTDADGGTVFRAGTGPPPTHDEHLRDWTVGSRRYVEALTPGRLAHLCDELGVRSESLEAIGVGWRQAERCYTFPEKNAAGKIIGINRRYSDGKKKVIRGGRRGITVPHNFDELPDPVLIVEGPSDVVACLSLKLTSVGRYSARGSKHLAELLAHRLVLVVGENDRKPSGDWPGREGALLVARALATAWGVAVRWALPPDGAKDLRAWLASKNLDVQDRAGCGIAGTELVAALTAAAIEESPATTVDHIHAYLATDGGLIHVRQTNDGPVEIPLTNFNARIAASVVHDDGAEALQSLEIEAQLDGRTVRCTIPASRFAALGWVIENLGPKAIVYPGFSAKDHTRAAIQLLSTNIESRTIFGHTGWRQVDNQWVYLHAGGAIGTIGTIGTVGNIQLPRALEPLQLSIPTSDEQLSACVHSELSLLECVPDRLGVPLLCAGYRAVLGGADFSIHLVGPTGAGKSELVALIQQHFGPGFDARHLPGSWSSTGNALEALAFVAKDAVLVVDDFSPTGSVRDVSRLHSEADRILRAQGNRSGRHRLRPDGTLRPVKVPRGLILSSGEDVPRGQSLAARMLVLEIGPTDLNWDALTQCQRQAAAGTYAAAMGAFVRWLAERYETVHRQLDQECAELRLAAAQEGGHRRTPSIVGSLALGWRYFLRFAQYVCAISEDESKVLWQRGWKAIQESAANQTAIQEACEPTRRFRELLASAIAAGLAHIADEHGEAPEGAHDAKAFGWRKRTVGTTSEWQPQGVRIGWVAGDDWYLDLGAALRAVQNVTSAGVDGLTIGAASLRKRLHEQNLLVSTDTARKRLTVRRTLQGARVEVLNVCAGFVYREEPSQSSQSSHEPLPVPENADLQTDPWDGRVTEPSHKPSEPPAGVSADGLFPMDPARKGGAGNASDAAWSEV